MRSEVVGRAGLVALAILGAACRRDPAPSAKPAEVPAGPAVATFEGGSVTAGEVDRAVLDLPAQQRQPADGDLLRWYEQIARDLAMRKVLVAGARQAGLDRGPDFDRARDEARRQAAVSLFLEKNLPVPAAPTAEEIETYYKTKAKDFEVPVSRQTFHLFRRVAPGGDPAPAMAEMRRLRERIVAGEDFGKLAAEASDSESRHQKGLLGWVTRGKVAPDLERVVFSLQPRVPSQPVKTATGVHLFLVAAETPAKKLTLSEVRNAIAVVLINQKREAALQKLIENESVPDSFVPSTDELRALFEGGDPNAVVLRVGDFQQTVGQFQMRILAGQTQPFSAGPDSPAHALLLALVQREKVYRLARAQRVDTSAEAEAAANRLLEGELAALQLQKQLAARVDKDEKRLHDYYDANRTRFSTPLRVKVQRLSVPLRADANQVMARLERARAELDSGKLEFATLAAELGGTLSDPALELPTQMAQRERRPSVPIASLKPGRHGAPYRTEDRIEMSKVIERAEPQLQPFEAVRTQVRTALLVTHREAEYAALVQETLNERRFTVATAELEAMLKRPAPGAS